MDMEHPILDLMIDDQKGLGPSGVTTGPADPAKSIKPSDLATADGQKFIKVYKTVQLSDGRRTKKL